MNWLKGALATVGGVLLGLFGKMSVPVYILVGCNVIDYATGIFSAKAKGEKITSKKGYQGIVKKVCMWLLVVVGWIVDMVIAMAGKELGITLTLKCTVALIVCLWEIFNELVSVLENMATIGLPIPSFLVKLIKWMDGKIEEKGDKIVPEEVEHGNSNDSK